MKTLAVPDKEQIATVNQQSLDKTVDKKDTEKVFLVEEEPIVIPDECGDTLWDAVLVQEKNRL